MLKVEGLRKQFGDRAALDGISFNVRPGEMFGFVGANGAGKTTTMRIIMGLLAADSGRVEWSGRTLDLRTRRRFGYMPEERGLYQKMKVGEHIDYFGRLRGLNARAAQRATRAALERFGLTVRRDDTVEKLSLGNQQRVQLAVALVHDPEVIVMDEPFSGLDPQGVDAVGDVLVEQCKSGTPVIFSSHQLDLVERLCDSVGIIAGGRMVASGQADDVRAREGTSRLRVVVPDAPPDWGRGVPGVRTVTHDGPQALFELHPGADDQAVLRAALNAGRVDFFGWQRPKLVEIFREVVQQ